jgi:hypothetical protein
MSGVEKSLGNLAERINEEHRACETAAGAALAHAMSAGELMTEAKQRLPHGAFGPWLAENFAGSGRTARAYMRVYSRREELEAKRQGSATLSLDGALRALGTPKDAPETPAPAATLEEAEARVEATLSEARAWALGAAEGLDAIHQRRGYEALGYASFEDYVRAEFGAQSPPFPLPYEVVSDEAGEPLPVFAMAESINAWFTARVLEHLLRDDETLGDATRSH